MEIQQQENENLAACVHGFKTAAKWCTFDSDTAAMCIFLKGLWDAHITVDKICEKDLQTLSEVIRIVEKYHCNRTNNNHAGTLYGQHCF